MANLIGQVTIPAAGKVTLANGWPQHSTGGAGPLTAKPSVGHIYFQQLLVQNNSAVNVRLGDVSVTTTRGLLIVPSSSGNFGALINYGSYLGDWYIAGPAGTVIDFICLQ
jgi:hypothetical protein